MNSANITRAVASLSRDMFRVQIYSDDAGVYYATDCGLPLFGESRPYGTGLHCVSYHPWRLQIQEQRDGVWHVIHNSDYPTKAAGRAAMERMGITTDDVDHVGHQKDSICSSHLA